MPTPPGPPHRSSHSFSSFLPSPSLRKPRDCIDSCLYKPGTAPTVSGKRRSPCVISIGIVRSMPQCCGGRKCALGPALRLQGDVLDVGTPFAAPPGSIPAPPPAARRGKEKFPRGPRERECETEAPQVQPVDPIHPHHGTDRLRDLAGVEPRRRPFQEHAKGIPQDASRPHRTTSPIPAEIRASAWYQPVQAITTAPTTTPTEEMVSPITCRNALRTLRSPIAPRWSATAETPFRTGPRPPPRREGRFRPPPGGDTSPTPRTGSRGRPPASSGR